MFKDNLNRIVKEIKKSKKISQAQIAEMVGITPSGFTDWLKGRGSPSPEKITKLAEVLGVAVSDLIDEPEKQAVNSFNNLNNSVAINGNGSVIINSLPNQKATTLSDIDKKLLMLTEKEKQMAYEFIEFIKKFNIKNEKD